MVAAAWAVQVAVTELPCPVGGGTVAVHDRLSQNAAGGWDSDLASYGSEGQWRAYRVATCTSSLFSLYNEDMRSPVPVGKVPALTTALSSAVAALPDPSSPRPWDRYAIAAAMYAVLGRDDAFLGDLWLEASWTARDAAVGYYAAVEGPIGARTILELGWEELKKPLSASDRRKLLFNMARVAHRGGWPSERDAHLVALEATGPLEPREAAGVARLRLHAIDIERALQAKATDHYTRALHASLEPRERARITYLLGDLARRRGDSDAARRFLAQVVDDPAADNSWRTVARFLLDS